MAATSLGSCRTRWNYSSSRDSKCLVNSCSEFFYSRPIETGKSVEKNVHVILWGCVVCAGPRVQVEQSGPAGRIGSRQFASDCSSAAAAADGITGCASLPLTTPAHSSFLIGWRYRLVSLCGIPGGEQTHGFENFSPGLPTPDCWMYHKPRSGVIIINVWMIEGHRRKRRCSLGVCTLCVASMSSCIWVS